MTKDPMGERFISKRGNNEAIGDRRTKTKEKQGQSSAICIREKQREIARSKELIYPDSSREEEMIIYSS